MKTMPEIRREGLLTKMAAKVPRTRQDDASTPLTGLRLRRKRVAMVMYSFYPNDPRPRRAIDALLNEGMDVDLICLRGGNAPARELMGRLNILRLPIKRHRDSKFAYALNYSAFILLSAVILAVRSLKGRYDLVHIHNMPDMLVLTAMVPKALGAKVLLDLHDPMPELMMSIFGLYEDSVEVRVIRWLEKWSLARAHFVVTTNLAFKRVFASRSCSPDKIGIVMNSPNDRIFPLRSPRSYPSSNGVPARRFVIMYHGSMVERNGLDHAVEAFARVRESVPTAELRVYGGETPFLVKVLNRVHDLGLEGHVRFYGSRKLDDLVRDIEDCDVGIIPNHRNAFTEINMPTRIFEYLTMGKPVIAPRTTGIRDYFTPDSLIFFEPGDVEDLARKIKYVAFHYNDAVDTAGRGQALYQAHAWSQERRTLLNVVNSLLNGWHPEWVQDGTVMEKLADVKMRS